LLLLNSPLSLDYWSHQKLGCRFLNWIEKDMKEMKRNEKRWDEKTKDIVLFALLCYLILNAFNFLQMRIK
jgi:hypothetical protein